jgi:hypothetical protein
LFCFVFFIEIRKEENKEIYCELNSEKKHKINYNLIEAQNCLIELETKVQNCLKKLFKDFVIGTQWRSHQNLCGRIDSLKNCCYYLRQYLKEFLEFCSNSL